MFSFVCELLGCSCSSLLLCNGNIHHLGITQFSKLSGLRKTIELPLPLLLLDESNIWNQVDNSTEIQITSNFGRAKDQTLGMWACHMSAIVLGFLVFNTIAYSITAACSVIDCRSNRSRCDVLNVGGLKNELIK